MNYLAITVAEVANGTGVRVALWVAGCEHQCKGCQNPQSWDFSAGKVFTDDALDQIRKELSKPYCTGLTLTGGDPLSPKNLYAVTEIAKTIKTEFPDKDIWCYTGYTFKEVYNYPILEYLDVVIDGEFKCDERDVTLYFRGSRNQNVWRKYSNMWGLDLLH